ncbi:MAG: hypothetical protein KDB14_23400 [Planctomycetales bacterium]|nr:hypothetical protein [Planctomycetales bacterium]
MHDLRSYGGGGGSNSLLDGSGAEPELLSSLPLDELPDELPLPESEPELLEDVELLLTGSPDDDSSTTLLEGGSMSEPLDELEISLLLGSTTLLLGSTTLELGSTTLDDGSPLEDPLEDSNELDEPELLPEDDPLLDPLDELEQ